MIQKKLVFAAPILLAGLLFGGQSALACACCGTYKVVNVASWDVLNIRTGPSARTRKIGSIASGEGCIIKTGRRSGKWHQISYSGVTGWVHSRYLRYIK